MTGQETNFFSRRLFNFCLGILLLATTSNAKALGSIDDEVRLAWWNNDFSAGLSDDEFDAGAIAGHAELWLTNRWGLRGALYESDRKDVGLGSGKHFSIDVKSRLFSATDNTFFAVGFGWEDIELDNGAGTNGPRFLLEGRVSILGAVSIYGLSAWIPKLDNAASRTDMAAQEIEAGVVFDPFPSFSVRAGYRSFSLDFDDEVGGNNQRAESKGFLLGAGFHW